VRAEIYIRYCNPKQSQDNDTSHTVTLEILTGTYNVKTWSVLAEMHR